MKPERLSIDLLDEQGQRLQAAWSRSAKHLIVSLGGTHIPYGQALLDHGQVDERGEQAEELAAFLRLRPPEPAAG